MAKKTKRRPHTSPSRRQRAAPKPAHARWRYLVLATAIVTIAVVLALTLTRRGGGGPSSAGLPHTPDYHSLLVSPSDPRKLTLGTHNGLYQSVDGGRHWRFTALAGQDAMNLAHPTAATIWLAGHEVFKKSSDAGLTWQDVRPSGLPGLDIHGFAVALHDPNTLYAAIAGQGLYRSRDGGRSFTLFSRSVGGNVMALAVTADGRILAGDKEQGLLDSRDGTRWKQTLRAQLMGLAINPADPSRVLATGAGIALSTDGGRSWRSVLDLPAGAGPVAWSASNPKLAYAVGFDRVVYRSQDGGESWQPVNAGT